MIERIVSGGQTGVDRAALDVALALGVPCSGWCPRGRRAEDGPIPERYPLRETPTANYAERTACNVRDTDGTLILARGPLRGGTALTARLAEREHKPLHVVDLAASGADAASRIVAWLRASSISVMNVAGPRESESPGIHREARALLQRIITLDRQV